MEQVIRAHGETIKFSTGNILSANLSRSTLLALNAMSWVEKIDCPLGKILPMNDVMVINNNVDSAYFGYAPLVQGYDGTGVVIGDIDLPYDVYHADFTNAVGENRIKGASAPTLLTWLSLVVPVSDE